jgi:hypothetical protein
MWGFKVQTAAMGVVSVIPQGWMTRTPNLSNALKSVSGHADPETATRSVRQKPPIWLLFRRIEHTQPYSRHGASQGDLLVGKQIENEFGLEVWSGEDQLATIDDSREGQPPCVRLKHRHCRQNRVMAGNGKLSGSEIE